MKNNDQGGSELTFRQILFTSVPLAVDCTTKLHMPMAAG
jgi:hypothetical protein